MGRATHFNKFETRKNFKFDLIEGAALVGKYGFPRLRHSHSTPRNLVPFNMALTQKNPENKWVHFFIDDYQFERVWHSPERYLSLLKKFEGVITPDFSMYLDMPLAQQIWNCYRNRVMAFWMQKNGINIIPVVEWADYSNFEWCLDGIPKESTIAVGTYGCNKSAAHKYGLLKGLYRIHDELKPRSIVCYGLKTSLNLGLSPKMLLFDSYCKTIKERV